MKISAKINDADRLRLERLLKGIEAAAPGILRNALSKTLAGVRADVIEEVGKVLTCSKAVIESATTITEPTSTSLTGAIEISARPLPLSDFETAQATGGVAVRVKKGRGFKVIPGTFYGKRGGVFWRAWHDGAGRAKRNIAYGRLPAKYRLPVKKLFSSSIAAVAGDQMETIMRKLESRLQENLNDELNTILKSP